ncbi:MAG: BCAM0308 family protein [Balneolaceae bacterium]|nr:BCAM0308 family protein [Balneolaceae bacterium]
MKRKKKRFIYKRDRTRIFNDERSDVYREKRKYKDSPRCADCGALFLKGRWTWEESEGETHESLCPACQRIEENYPAGFVIIRGPFFSEHSREILQMIHNLERSEREEHPLERIMEISRNDDHTQITTTGTHMARRLGSALKSSYRGNLEISYDAEQIVRVSWSR